VPYVNTLNQLHVGEFNNFKDTAPDGTPVDKIMKEFDKPVGNYYSFNPFQSITNTIENAIKRGKPNPLPRTVPPMTQTSGGGGNQYVGQGGATPPTGTPGAAPINTYAGNTATPFGQPYPTGLPVVPYVRPVCYNQNPYGYNPMCMNQPGYTEDTGNSGGQLQDLSCSDQPVFGDANYQSPACCNNADPMMEACGGEYNMCHEKTALEMEFGANSTGQKRRHYRPKP
jgi:hypothetical protein